ncbi:hypothetical protein YC2023_072141 [Brassica napus]
MSTTGRERHSVLHIFKGHQECTRRHATSGALPASGPYLRLSLFQGSTRLTHVQVPFTWNLSPLRPLKFSFEYLLLPPRSVPTAALALGFAATAVPSYSSRPGSCPDGRVSTQLGTVTRLPVHLVSPVLLTKNSPLGALDSVGWLNKAATASYLFINSFPSSSYPEGNFGGNQLLDGSISLSPLYPSHTNDLHVSIAAGLHKSFLWLHPAHAYFTIFRVPTGMLTLEPFSEDQGRSATPWSVFQDGSNGEPIGRCPEHADAKACREVTTLIRISPRPESIGRPDCSGYAYDPTKTEVLGMDERITIESAGTIRNRPTESTTMILLHVYKSQVVLFPGYDNDPFAGSPTETLLRLLLPLNDKV